MHARRSSRFLDHGCNAILIAVLVLSTSAISAQEKSIQFRAVDPNSQQEGPYGPPVNLTGQLTIGSDGELTATLLDPQQLDGEPFCSVQNGDCETPAPVIEITSLSVAPAAAAAGGVQEGTLITFDWRTQGATRCRFSGPLWPGGVSNDLPPDSRDATLAQRRHSTEGLAGLSPFQVSLNCLNGDFDPQSPESKTITVIEPDEPDPELPPNCAAPERQPPPGWERLTVCNRSGGFWRTDRDCRFWESVFAAPFLSPSTNSRYLATNRNQPEEYIALRISTDGLSPTRIGQINFEVPTDDTPATRIVTISECPGDFHPDQETGCYRRITGGSQLRWGGVDSTRNCKLESGRTYFVNMLFTEDAAGTPSSELTPHPNCVDSICSSLVQPFN